MNYIYIDCTAAQKGNGTISNPFNSINDLNKLEINYPITISIKKGTILRESLVDINNIFLNSKSTASYLTSYGEGANPIWISSSHEKSHIHSHGIKNFVISDIDFYSNENGVDKPFIYAIPVADDIGNANILITKCNFQGTPKTIHSKKGKVPTIYFEVEDKQFNQVNKIKISLCNFNFINAGIHFVGNCRPANLETNVGDSNRSYGVKIITCSFTNIINAGILLVGCASKENNQNFDSPYASGFENIYYSSYRTDVYNPLQDEFALHAQWDSPIWFTLCNKLIGQTFSIHGSGPGHPDRMAVDFDYHCWDCVIKHGYTSNNSRAVMFISGPMERTIFNTKYSVNKPQEMTDHEWYHTRRFGTGNNIYEYVLSFNDGIMRNYAVENTDSVKINANRYVYNCIVRNCTFIDTISLRNIFLLGCNPTDLNSDHVSILTIENCLFYWRFLETLNLMDISHIRLKDMLKNIKICNSVLYSEKWNDDLIINLKLVTTFNIIMKNPEFENIILSPPSNLHSGLYFSFKSNSPILNNGSPNNTPDIAGRIGSNIGWMQ